jgi:AcrR family transcriptional regulator
MESLLRAAEEVFAEDGYERATTNLIASRASVSPGTLYQFYPNKDAMAEALAARYAERLGSLHNKIFESKIAGIPLEKLIDMTVDPFIEFHHGAPAFEALFLGAATSPELAGRIHILHDTVSARLALLFERRAPEARPEDLHWAAEVAVGVFRGLLPLINSLKGSKRSRAIRELKTVLHRYLEPLLKTRKA